MLFLGADHDSSCQPALWSVRALSLFWLSIAVQEVAGTAVRALER